MRLETQWHGLERLTYYVLFPVLLVQTLVKADLAKVPVAGVGGALLLSALLMSLLCLALRPLLARVRRRRPRLHLDLPGRDPLADLRGAGGGRQSLRRPGWRWPRWRWSRSFRWSMSSASPCWRITPRRKSDRSAPSLMTVVTQSPDLGLRHRARDQRHAFAAAKDLARGRRRARPLLARDRPAGDRRGPASRRACSARASPPSLAVFLKLVLMPVIAIALALLVRADRLESRDRGRLLGGADVVERLCAGAADGRRRAAAGADHHAADDSGGDHDADRDRAGALAVMRRTSSQCEWILLRTLPASQKLCTVAAKLFTPCRMIVSQVEPVR